MLNDETKKMTLYSNTIIIFLYIGDYFLKKSNTHYKICEYVIRAFSDV